MEHHHYVIYCYNDSTVITWHHK